MSHWGRGTFALTTAAVLIFWASRATSQQVISKPAPPSKKTFISKKKKPVGEQTPAPAVIPQAPSLADEISDDWQGSRGISPLSQPELRFKPTGIDGQYQIEEVDPQGPHAGEYVPGEILDLSEIRPAPPSSQVDQR